MKLNAKLNEGYMKIFNWNTNPFSFRILPELFIGYAKEREKIFNSIQNNEKFSMLIGPTGSGKTTLLKSLPDKLGSGMEIFYLSKPPKEPEDLVKIFTNFIGFGILERISSRKKEMNLYNLSEWVNKKMKKMNMALLVDEAHEASIETLEWLRTLTDQIDGLSVVIAGLPSLEFMLKDNLETFTRRINTRVELTNLTKSETRELIKRRIEWSGGDDIKPFTSETIEFMYEKTGGFPREVIRVCNEYVQKAVENNISTIDLSFLKERETTKRIPLSSINSMPNKQRCILEFLAKHENLTPADVVSKLGAESYKSKDNAIRSVNNILKRLTKEGFVVRKGKGKSYVYSLSDKTRTLLVNA